MIILNLFAAAVSLGVMLAASEVLVRRLTVAGHHLGFSGAVLGFVVALGADAPEISTALIALATGSQAIGVGVVEGSNIYNLAGLLGLSALAAGPLLLARTHIRRESSVNVAVTGSIVAMFFLPRLARVPLALAGIVLTGFLFAQHARDGRDGSGQVPWRPLAVAGLAALVLVATSVLVLHFSEALIAETHAPSALLGLIVLPVATSIPNTWAAVSLARKGLPEAVLSSAFNSNLINLSIGIGLTSLLVDVRPTHAAMVFDGPYLLAMTIITSVLLLTSSRLTRWEGGIIIAMYGLFLALRVGVVGL